MTARFFFVAARSVALVALILPGAGPLSAQDDFFATLDVEIEDRADADGPSLLGWVSQKIGYGLASPGPLFSREDAGLSSLETSLFLQFDTDLGEDSSLRMSGKAYHDEIYRYEGESGFHPEEISRFRNRFELRDLYLEHQAENGLYLKAGHQILAWGMAEFLRVSDIINVEDRYTVGQQELEDLRLQVPALLASRSVGDWVLDGVVTVAAGYDRFSPARDEFDPFVTLRPAGLGVDIRDPEKDYELFVRASTSLSRGDLQLVAGEFNDNALTGRGVALSGGVPTLRLGQDRIRAVAVAGNWVHQNWLFFSELGLHTDKALQPGDGGPELLIGDWERRDQIMTVVGAEFSGFENLLLSVEIDNIQSRGPALPPGWDGRQTSYGLRLHWTALNERLTLSGAWNDVGSDIGRVSRLSLDYDLSDAYSVGLLWVDYASSPASVFYPYRNNDMLELQFQFNFQY